MKIEMTSKDGVTLFTAGKYCTENIEVTPTFNTSGGGGGSAEIITKYAYSGGTAVPNTGTIENIYWNTSLTMEEINTIIENANLTWLDMGGGMVIYPLYLQAVEGVPTSMPCILNLSQLLGESAFGCMDMLNEENTIFVSSKTFAEMAGISDGWYSEYINNNGVIQINSELLPSFEDMGFSSIGAENDKLINLVSVTEYSKIPVETLYLDGVYESFILQLTTNGKTDTKEFIENNKKIPLKVEVNVPDKFKVSIAGELEEITEDDVKGITGNLREYAFGGCANLKTAVIPSITTHLARGLFKNCINLESVVIPEGVTAISAGCFAHTWALDSIEIPASVETISDAYDGDMEKSGVFEMSHIKSVTFAENSQLKTIGRKAFYWCSYLENITIPEGVTKIGEYAFNNCDSITSINIPKSVELIDHSAFEGCGNLTKVTFHTGSLRIGDRTFMDCESVEVYDFRNATAIPEFYLGGSGVFGGRPETFKIIVPDSLYEQWIASSDWNKNWSKYASLIVKASEYTE